MLVSSKRFMDLPHQLPPVVVRCRNGCELHRHHVTVDRPDPDRDSRRPDRERDQQYPGIRVVGLRPQAMLETRTIKNAFEPRAKATGMTWEQWQQLLASRTHGKRLMTVEEMANVAVFMASDQAGGITGTTVNLTMGSLDD